MFWSKDVLVQKGFALHSALQKMLVERLLCTQIIFVLKMYGKNMTVVTWKVFGQQNSQNSKFSKIQIFPKLGHQISIFSQIQKSPNHPRGGWGVKKIVDFFHFLGHFFI